MNSREIEVGCLVEVENTWRSLHAHVILDGNLEINPGDEVTVLGEPINPAFGETLTLRRRAIVKRASTLEDWFTRLVGRFEIGELFESNFSEWRRS